MPIVRRSLGNHGVTFTNAYVVNPVCCSSRSTILTGLYSHSTGVYTNDLGGGFAAFDDHSTIATWLHDGGYRTGLFGKYLNGPGAYLINIQAHTLWVEKAPGEDNFGAVGPDFTYKREGGQLLLIRIPGI